MAASQFQGRLDDERSRPKHLKAEVGRQLEELDRRCSALLQLLSELHGPTVRNLQLAAVIEGGLVWRPWPGHEGMNELVPVAEQELGEARQVVAHLASWAAAARRRYQPRGRNRSIACQWFSRDLLDVWHWYAKPGSGHVINPLTEEHSGRFLEFGRACYRPILRVGNLDSYLIETYHLRAAQLHK